jgi:hypothetical protein
MNRHTHITKGVLISGLLAMVAILSTACADSDKTDVPQAEPTETRPAMSREERIEQRRQLQAQAQKKFAQVPKEDAAQVTGEVPRDLLDKIYADLEQRSGGQRSEFTLSGAESVQWNDGSLGCPEPGQVYPQVITNGYRVMIEYLDQSYDYRATDKGFFKLCPGFSPTR